MRVQIARLLSLVVFLTACAWSATPLTATPVSTGIFPSQTPPPIATVVISSETDWQAAYAPSLVASQRARGTNLPGAIEYRLDLTLSNDLLNLTGHEAVTYTNRETVPLNEIHFHLFAKLIGGNMKILNVAVDGVPVQEQYEQYMDSLLIVPLASPLAVGASVTMSMDFTLKIPRNPEISYGVLVAKENIATLAHAYPIVAVYQGNWDNTFPSTHGDLTHTDASFFTVNVTAPAGVTLIASGIESVSQAGAETQTAQFLLGPARDFMLVAARDFVVHSRSIGEVTVNSFAPASLDEKSTRDVLEIAVESIRIFNQRYAPYPYTEFDIVATPTLALGVEYPGLIALSERLYAPDALPYFLESTVAHEVGHQWFYNLVGNDQLNQPWLDESLTQFITWQYYADRYGEAGAQAFKASLEQRWYGVDNQPIPVGKPVAAYSHQEYSSIVYGRGGLFFFALKDEIGQEAFDVFLKSYAETYTWELASTESLRQSAEKSCSCNLAPLFAEWVYP
jgi:hypothetical protein